MDQIIATKSELGAPLVQSLFQDRRAQFVDRLGWDLCVSPEGLEIDEYDNERTTFLVVREGQRHVGSCRVRPAAAGTMLIDHFSQIFPGAAAFLHGQAGALWELTRFCRSPNAGQDEAREMLVHLAEMLDDFRDANSITGYVAVVYPEIGR
ncbi:MAG: acyl-homoserine-lactone synthase, partial [Pseudomonadota bacterium]